MMPSARHLENPAEVQTFLQAMYKEQCDQARQHEALRQQGTTITLTLAGAILTASTATASTVMAGLCALGMPWLFAGYALPGLFLIGLGWFSRMLSLKHYERNRFHTTRAGWYRTEIENMTGRPELGKPLRDGSYQSHEKKWRRNWPGRNGDVVEDRVHSVWLRMYGFVAAIGLVRYSATLTQFSSLGQEANVGCRVGSLIN